MPFDFSSPDYDAVFNERMQRLQVIRRDGLTDSLKEFYKENPANFINDWGVTFDPRNPERGLPSLIPFILFQKQEEYIKWLHERWKNREDGLAEKSRDMGVSWLCVAFAVWMWIFYPGTVVGFGSRKEEYVDKIGDPKSLFWKIRQFIKYLPEEFKPKSYEEPFMRIINNDNGSSIVGESGDNIGRGNRTSIYFKDESAFYERADGIDAALSQTSNCKIDVSTPNGNGNAFFRKRMNGKIPVFSFHWKDDPRKDEAWYQKQKNTLDAVIVAQEIDIDYNASVSDAFMDGALITAAQLNAVNSIVPVGPWFIGVDAAHFGDDESVIAARRGRLTLPLKAYRQTDGIALAGHVEGWCRDLESAGSIIGAIYIELDGPGVSCYDQLKQGRYKEKTVGIHTGARVQDERNYNKKARMWRKAKDYIGESAFVLPPDNELRSQLASVKYLHKDGLLLMQPKKDYKKAYGRSPDRADAWVLTFADEIPMNESYSAPHMSFGRF